MFPFLQKTMKPRLVEKLWVATACFFLATAVRAQSNYASQANNVDYQGEGLPEQTVLDGKVNGNIIIKLYVNYNVNFIQNFVCVGDQT